MHNFVNILKIILDTLNGRILKGMKYISIINLKKLRKLKKKSTEANLNVYENQYRMKEAS